MVDKLICCPHCGSDSGYYTKDYISGPCWFYHNYDGKEADNSSMYEFTNRRQGKVAYCPDCNKRIALIKDLED